MTTHPEAEASVLHDLLSVYDRRFLDLDAARRRRLVQSTRQVLGEELSEQVRAALPAAYRIRAFCIRHGLEEELERLIRDEADGHQEGAVVVGGRAYAVYPYLRGVPRHDADITDEVAVTHRLDAVAWQGTVLRVQGWAMLERVHTRDESVELVLRERTSRAERPVPATERDSGFEARIDARELDPGRWDVHVAVSALGVTREARMGTIRGPRLKAEPVARTVGDLAATAYFTKGGHLALKLAGRPGRRPLAARIRRLRR